MVGGARLVLSSLRELRAAPISALRGERLKLAVLWLALSGGLAFATTRVVDWFVMTDELFYERLAISIARTHSPLPRIHGELIANVNQLYPLLLAPLFSHGLVPSSLRDAHALNAFVMASAALPAFLLTWDVTRDKRLSYLVALLTVCVPWIVLSSLLLTEVVAYPAFIWAMLGMHRALRSQTAAADIVAFLLIAVAVLARAQFFALFLVLPVALVLHRARSDRSLRGLVAAHRLLLVVYAVCGASAVVLAAFGRLSSVLGTYSGATQNVAPSGIGRAVIDHLAVTVLATGLLPFLVGGAWLIATLVKPSSGSRHAFASIALVSMVAVIFEVTSFDLRFGAGTVIDRYLFYVVPLFLVAFAGAITETTMPRWSLLLSAAVAVATLVHAPLPRFPKLNVDRPLAATNGALISLAGSVRAAHITLAVGVIVILVLLVLAPSLLRRRTLATLLVVLVSAAFAAETGGAFSKLFATAGSGSRPGSLAEAEFFAWIDKALDGHAKVTMIPFPLVVQNYAADVTYWWDVEFWNRSVEQDLVLDDAYSWTPKTFPKRSLAIDSVTGRANVSPTEYVAQASADTRFHIATAPGALAYRGTVLARAEEPWRADWVTSGLFEDGWTRPGVTATLKVFAEPGQTAPVERFVTIAVRRPAAERRASIRVSSDADVWHERSLPRTTTHQIGVCVPAHGWGEIKIASPSRTVIYGDPTTVDSYARAARVAGVLITSISLADETGGC